MLIATLSLLLSCSGSPEEEPIDGPRMVRRLALDLLGEIPSEEELDRVEQDPEAWRDLRDEYLEDERLADRLVGLLAESWHTRLDVFDIPYMDYNLDLSQEYAYERSVGEEPLRLLAEVAVSDLPWWTIVTADWTMATDLSASIWPLEIDAGEADWRRAAYTDGRPYAGVLSTNGLWWRYTTTEANVNRGRVAQIFRLLICEDILQRPIAFGDADTTEGTIAEMVHEDPYCLACHSSVDPVASTLFGFWWFPLYSEVEETTYHPERESLWDDYLGVEPAWFGQPVENLADLGYAIANDSRFYTCSVETFAEGLWRRSVTNDDRAQLEALYETFLLGDVKLKPLLSAITETAAYQFNDTEDADAVDRAERLMSPVQFANSVEALTGFRWVMLHADALDSDDPGYRLLAGGVDGDAIQAPQHLPGLTWALVVERTAQGAADWAVSQELENGSDGPLFDALDLDARPGDDAFTDTLYDLYWRLYAVRAEPAWVDDIVALWWAVEAVDGAAAAWKSVVSVMLRDPAFVAY